MHRADPKPLGSDRDHRVAGSRNDLPYGSMNLFEEAIDLLASEDGTPRRSPELVRGVVPGTRMLWIEAASGGVALIPPGVPASERPDEDLGTWRLASYVHGPVAAHPAEAAEEIPAGLALVLAGNHRGWVQRTHRTALEHHEDTESRARLAEDAAAAWPSATWWRRKRPSKPPLWPWRRTGGPQGDDLLTSPLWAGELGAPPAVALADGELPGSADGVPLHDPSLQDPSVGDTLTVPPVGRRSERGATR